MTPKAKRTLANIHGWVGALAALFIIAVSVTGGLIAFSSHFMHWETRAMPTNVGPAPDMPDMAALLAAAQTEGGETFMPLGYIGPNGEIATPVSMVWGLSDAPEAGGESRVVTFDPATGEALGTFLLDRTWTHGLIEFHANLLAGPLGGTVVAVIGLLMTVLAVAGLVLAKPLRKRARGRRSRRWHRVVGVWLSAPVIVWGLSGTYWSQPEWASAFQPYPSGLPVEMSERLVTDCDKAVSPSRAIALAMTKHPGTALREADFAAPWQSYHEVTLASPANLHARDGDIRVLVAQRCDEIVLTQSTQTAGGVGAVLISLHTGEYLGPLRAPLILALGLALALITATGTILWWRRSIRP